MRNHREKLYTVTQEARERVLELLSAEVAREPLITFAYVYGSLLEREAVHDVDIGIYLGKIPDEGPGDYALDFSQRLSEAAGMPVDVRILNAAPVSFIFHVLRGRLIHCGDESLLADVMERTAARYLDIAPLLRSAIKEAYAP